MPTQKELLANMHDIDARLADASAEKQLATIAAAVGNKAEQKQVPFTKESPSTSKSTVKVDKPVEGTASPLGTAAWSVGDAPKG